MSAYIMDTISRIGSGLQAKDGEKARDRFWELYENDTAFLSKDLDSAEWVNLLDKDQLDTLKILQCEQIRSLRTQAYTQEADGLFFGAQGDGDSLNAWQAKREEIKARYAWPGTYR